MSPKYAIHSDSSFDESEGVRILSGKLEGSKTIKTFFSENDKTPNIDGFFEIINQEKLPVKQFVVQIKTVKSLEKKAEGRNKDKYTYSMDAKFLHYIKANVCGSPGIVFVVDTLHKNVFWKYISAQYLSDLHLQDEKKKTVSFTDNEMFTNVSDFSNEMILISNSINDKLIIKSAQEIASLNEAQEWFNRALNDLPFIKKCFYPNVFKFGIKNTPNVKFTITNMSKPIDQRKAETTLTDTYGLYVINKDNNDSGIKEFTPDDSTYMKYYNSCNMSPMNYVKDCLSRIIDEYFNSGALDAAFLPDIMLNEIVYIFWKRYIDKCRDFKIIELEYEEVDINYIRNRYNQLVNYINNSMNSPLQNAIKQTFVQQVNMSDSHKCDIIDIFINSKLINEARVLKNVGKTEVFTFDINMHIDKGYEMCSKAIDALSARNSIIGYKPIRMGYPILLDDYDVDRFFLNLTNTYNEIYKKMFGKNFNYKYLLDIKFNYYINHFDNVIIFNLHKYRNEDMMFSIKRDCNVDCNYKTRQHKEMIGDVSTIWFTDLFRSSMQYFSAINNLLYNGIAEFYEIEKKGVKIGYSKVNCF